MTARTRPSLLRRVLTPILISIGATLVIYPAIALVLIASETPQPPAVAEGGIAFGEAIEADYSGLPASQQFTARDGSELPYRLYQGGTERLIVLVHGSGWHGMQFHPMAAALASQGLGTVVAPDLRGHGAEPARRGDIDYIAQLEHDLADLIRSLQSEHDYGEVVVGCHSSGGGLVVRFAGGEHGQLADRYVLMAPFLKHDAPTTKPNSGGWAHPAIRRIIGLTMLNTVGITALNHLPVIAFAMPDDVLDGPLGHTATTQYSFRLNTGFAPRDDYQADLAALQQPFLLIAGAADESFYAPQYEPVISARTASGDYAVLPGISHIGVTTDPRAIDRIADWIAQR